MTFRDVRTPKVGSGRVSLFNRSPMARILLVDDEKVSRALYSDYLSEAGHNVSAVSSLEEAKGALSTDVYDAVVTDLILPKGDGMEILQHAKENYPGIEVIVITALNKVDPAVRAIKSGAAEYLVKPVAPEALQHAVMRALTTRQLLRENEQLRRDVELLETGQRIATTLDKERLLATACSSFAQVTRADAVLLHIRQSSGGFRVEGLHGIDKGSETPYAAAVQPFFDETATAPFSVDGIPSPYRTALVYPARDANTTYGFTVLLFRASMPENSRPSANYLSRHLGLALRNLDRFTEVEDLAYLDDLTHLAPRRIQAAGRGRADHQGVRAGQRRGGPLRRRRVRHPPAQHRFRRGAQGCGADSPHHRDPSFPLSRRLRTDGDDLHRGGELSRARAGQGNPARPGGSRDVPRQEKHSKRDLHRHQGPGSHPTRSPQHRSRLARAEKLLRSPPASLRSPWRAHVLPRTLRAPGPTAPRIWACSRKTAAPEGSVSRRSWR